MKRTSIAIMTCLTILGGLAGCVGGDSETNSTDKRDPALPPVSGTPTPITPQVAARELASCYAGQGTSEGTKLYATLRLTPGVGDAISGTYLVGESKAGGLSYAVTGSLKDDRLDSVFTAAAQGLNVTGTVDATEVKLDNPDGTFSVTEFTAGC